MMTNIERAARALGLVCAGLAAGCVAVPGQRAALAAVSPALPVAAQAMPSPPVLPLPGLGAAGLARPNPQRMGDNELGCAAIHHEAQALEKAVAEQQARIDAAQQSTQDTTKRLMSQGRGASSVRTATGLLGVVPGIGGLAARMVGSAATQVAGAAARSNAQDAAAQMLDNQQQLGAAVQALSVASARRDHLTQLFLTKDCKVSQLNAS